MWEPEHRRGRRARRILRTFNLFYLQSCVSASPVDCHDVCEQNYRIPKFKATRLDSLICERDTSRKLLGGKGNNRYNGLWKLIPGDFVFLEVFCALRLVHVEDFVLEDAAKRD